MQVNEHVIGFNGQVKSNHAAGIGFRSLGVVVVDGCDEPAPAGEMVGVSIGFACRFLESRVDAFCPITVGIKAVSDYAVCNATDDAQHASVERADQDRHIERSHHGGLDGCFNLVVLAFETNGLHVLCGEESTRGMDQFFHARENRLEFGSEPIGVHSPGARTEA